MTKLIQLLAVLFVGALAFPFGAQESQLTRTAPPDASQFQLEVVASGFPRALYVTHANDGSGRLFVVQQNGVIRVVNPDGSVVPEPFLIVSSQISADALGNGYTERGLLGLAFHPDFATNGRFFINYTEANTHDSIIARYEIDPAANTADPATTTEIFRLPQPYGNHNGGHLAFGNDGYLYVSLGDGGNAGDPLGNGQNKETLLGTILRLNVDDTDTYTVPADNPFVGREGADEIWAYGLRNVWRFSFDSLTGDLYLGDVGQNRWEEINYQPAGVGGVNYGWSPFEGRNPYSGAAAPADMVLPVAVYQHAGGHCSVTGGYLYRGDAVPTLRNAYIYGDFCSGQLWSLYRSDTGTWEANPLTDTPYTISSFGVDEAGELYLVDYGQTSAGVLYKFVPAG